jgi:hypothetical protein
MGRCVLVALLVAACGTEDPRRPTVEVIATEILAPTCGQVQCHSTTTMTSGLAFDTLAAAKVALPMMRAMDGQRSLYRVIHATGGARMPPDSPLDPADIALIDTWLANGAPL